MLSIIALVMHFRRLCALDSVRSQVLQLTSASASHSPFLVVLLIGLMFNSFALTLGLSILDPETKVTADSIMLHIFARAPFTLDSRLMWQLACLSWRLRSFLFELCRVYLVFFRWVLAARHILWSAYPGFCAVYPVVLAFNRFVLAYVRVALAAYRMVSAACNLKSATSRYAAFVLVLAAARVLSEEAVQMVCHFVRFVFVGTTLSRKTYKLLLACGTSLVILSWPRIKSAIYYRMYSLNEALWAFVILHAVRMRTRAILLCRLPLSAVGLRSRPGHAPGTQKAIVKERRVRA
ncbi:hypothetical protein LXA43DRAFT_403936 [Ganoderma leucocontextum]|nr:hypothetical protein LXA43DRAFT_403936 [Ganoderma leucocontextum]